MLLGDASPLCHLQIPPVDGAVPRARQATTQVVCDWGLPSGHDLVHAVRLAVSELVTNAVKHAGVLSRRIDITLRFDVAPPASDRWRDPPSPARCGMGHDTGTQVDRQLVVGQLYVGVHDEHPFCPKALLEVVDEDSGRGLLIVKHLVAEAGGTAGVIPDAPPSVGKTIWFALPVPSGLARCDDDRRDDIGPPPEALPTTGSVWDAPSWSTLRAPGPRTAPGGPWWPDR